MSNSAFTQNQTNITNTTATNLTGPLVGNGTTVNATAPTASSDVISVLLSENILTGSANFYNSAFLSGGNPWYNLIGNSNFNIWQRVALLGTSIGSVAGGTYLADRWSYMKSGSVVHTMSQSTNVPTVAQSGAFSQYSLGITVTTADASPAAGDYAGVQTVLEGYDWQLLAQRAFTLSFWVSSSSVGIYSVAFRNGGFDRSYIATYFIGATNTWQKVVISVPASPTAGTWNYTNGGGLYIAFNVMSGTTYQTSSGSWQTGSYLALSGGVNNCATTGSTFYISQVQIQPGTVANPTFQPITAADDLARCQRYFVATATSTVGLTFNSNTLYSYGTYSLPVSMRQGPSLNPTGSYTVNAGSAGTPQLTCSSPTSVGFGNAANNWTTNVIAFVTCGLTADF